MEFSLRIGATGSHVSHKSLNHAQGNLTYHFPTKRDLVLRLEAEARQAIRARRTSFRLGDVSDDYVEHLLFAMNLTWDHRFLLRDRAQYADDPKALRPDPDMAADFEELHGLLKRIEKEDGFRRDLQVDLRVLARSLWIVSRYWMDHLRESEGLERITRADQERGVQHHFAVLLPYLTAATRRELEAALLHAPDAAFSTLQLMKGPRRKWIQTHQAKKKLNDPTI